MRCVAMAAVLIAVAAALASCGGEDRSTRPTATPTTSAPTTTTRSSPRPSSPPPETCAERTLRRLGPDERVGQLFMGGVQVDISPAAVPTALGEAHVGSIVLFGVSTGGRTETAEAVDRAVRVAGTPAGTPPIVSVDQEGGTVQHLTGPGFESIPSALEQGLLAPDRLRRDARSWGTELLAAGVNLDLAPVADVVPSSIGTENQPIGALRRGYGADSEAVSRHVAAFVAGMSDAGVATTVKHFPGLGKVRGNTDMSSGVVDTSTTRQDPDLAPFRAGIDAGARFLMVSLATHTKIDPDRRAVFSPTVIEGMARDDLGFDGVVVSDDLGATEEVSEVPPARRALDFLDAGGDLVLVTGPSSTLLTMVEAVADEASNDAAFRAEVDQHALRVLTAKADMGLLTC